MLDLIIRGGTVIDPAAGRMEQRDIFVQGGRITDAQGDGEATRIIDARGCYVAPGLVDAHLHLFHGGNEMGGRADLVCPPNCVTTAIDAGSAGVFNVESFYHSAATQATTVKAAIGTCAAGVQMPPHEEIADPLYATPELLEPLFARFPSFLVGIKQRVHSGVTGPYGLRTLEQAAKTARHLRDRGYRCRLMVHFGDLAAGIGVADVLDLLESEDVFTHIYRPDNGSTIFNTDGGILPCIWQARKRGVLFESGCARSHLSFQSLERAVAQGFYPQIISTDLIGKTFYWAPSGWMMLKMSIYLAAGMPLMEVVRATTQTPASAYGLLEGAGTLRPGRPADIAVFRVEEREYVIDDIYGGHLTAGKLCVPMATVKEGQPVFQQVFLGR